jgi:tripartite-type tricarboxylate transporter receptor subunit TctC
MHYLGRILGAAALATIVTSTLAAAQGGGTISIIVPFAPGGSNDIVTRIIADQLTKDMQRSVIVVNKPGAAGSAGLGELARSQPDGRAFGVANISFAVNPYTIKDMGYDTETAFAPVGMVALVPLVMSVNPSVPAKTVKEFIELAKSKPGEIKFGSAGLITTGHLALELFSNVTGVKLKHVPYKGGASQMAAANGEVSGVFSTISTAKQSIDSGALVPLGVTMEKRDPRLPNVPTIAESGVPGFAIYDWVGLIAPKGVPAETIAKMNEALVKVLATPEVQQRIEAAGATVRSGSPEEMATHLKAEFSKWKTVVEENKIEAN